jgi:hypothetical protein
MISSPSPATALQAIDGYKHVGPLEHLNQLVKDARYCAVGAPDILRGCAARRSLPEGLIADLSLMITSAPDEFCP